MAARCYLVFVCDNKIRAPPVGPIRVSPQIKSTDVRSAHLLCFLVFLAGKHDRFRFLRNYDFVLFVSPLTSNLSLVCRLFFFCFSGNKVTYVGTFVEFFIWRENTTYLKMSTCRHFSRFDFFQQVVGLVQNFTYAHPFGGEIMRFFILGEKIEGTNLGWQTPKIKKFICGEPT